MTKLVSSAGCLTLLFLPSTAFAAEAPSAEPTAPGEPSPPAQPAPKAADDDGSKLIIGLDGQASTSTTWRSSETFKRSAAESSSSSHSERRDRTFSRSAPAWCSRSNALPRAKPTEARRTTRTLRPAHRAIVHPRTTTAAGTERVSERAVGGRRSHAVAELVS